MNDYYEQTRVPAYNSNMPNAQNAGRFDPLLSVVQLSPAVSEALGTQDGALPNIGCEAAGSIGTRAYATSLHETIHWWQHIGSSVGLLSGLTTAAQAALCIKYMADLGQEAPKPLVGALQAGRFRPATEDHPAWKAALCYRELELGNTFLVSPQHALFRVQRDPFLYESIGASICMHAKGAVWYIGRLIDPGGRSLASADSWLELYARSVKDRRLLFEENEVAMIPIGGIDVFEGQARLSELQYFCRSVESHTISDLRQMGLIAGVYAKCFDYFLKTLEVSEPASVVSPEILLFLLVCDFALNPSAGYPCAVPEDLDLLQDNHPGLRFAVMCNTARSRREELLSELKVASAASYRRAAAILAEPLGWQSPQSVAENVVSAFSRSSQGALLLDQRDRGDFGAQDVPARFILSEHFLFSEAKANCPHFFCWPGMFLTGSHLDNADELLGLQELLAMTSPPFLATSPAAGVDSVAIFGLSTIQARVVANRYFQTQATVDLFRQWIAHFNQFPTNQFLYDYSWKPNLTQTDIDNLKLSFFSTFGVAIDSIRILT